MSKISIIMPVYNGEKYLAEAIESVLQQDYKDKEIIVINDGSTDNTAQVIKQFDNKIISFSHENRGLGASRNAGIRVAKGDYFAFLDHDDIWEKTKLSSQMQLMRSAQNDPLIFSKVQQFICPSLTEQEKQKLLVNQNVMPGYIAGTLLLSKPRLMQIGDFIEEKQVGEFIDWYLRAIEMNLPILMLDEVALYRRVHNNNMGRQHDLYKRTDYLKILKASLDRRREHAI